MTFFFSRSAQADSAENVKSILLSSQTEQMLLKMGWKFRKSAKHQLKKRAAQFDVTVPEEFAGFNSPSAACGAPTTSGVRS